MKSHDERIKKMFDKAKELTEKQTAVTERSSEGADIEMFSANWNQLYTM